MHRINVNKSSTHTLWGLRHAQPRRHLLRALPSDWLSDGDTGLASLLKIVPSKRKDARILLSLDSIEANSSDDAREALGCLRKQGFEDVLVVSTSAEALARVRLDGPVPGKLGNDIGVRAWQGDAAEALPSYLGPFDGALVFSGRDEDQQRIRSLMLRISLMLRPGGSAFICGCDGERDRGLADLPFVEGEGLRHQNNHISVLRIPQYYKLQKGPVFLDGPVVTGFGRGSRKMGIPTANLDPKPIADKLSGLHNGVYFGWAQLDPRGSDPSLVWSPEDGERHMMVMNVGRRPTVSGDVASEQEISVEAHILHK